MSAIVWEFEHSLALPFFGIAMKTDHFQSRGHCWVFKICWHIECSTFTASSFRIWNSSTGIAPPLLALFVVMLPTWLCIPGYLALGWVIIPSWLSGSWRYFLYSFSVYSLYLLISSVSVRSIPFLSFIVPIFAWNVSLGSLIFLKRSLLLPSHFSRVRLCATPQMAAHQAPPSLGFSRQEHWSGLPFPSPMHVSEKWKGSHSVVSNS